MKIARVIGSTVSTVKDPKLTGYKLLIVQHASPNNSLFGDAFIAVDTVGAGEGELVMVVEGSSARYTGKTEASAVDAVIIGILDSITVDNEIVFRKS
jgi:ethanolamine utilization protein EutN